MRTIGLIDQQCEVNRGENVAVGRLLQSELCLDVTLISDAVAFLAEAVQYDNPLFQCVIPLLCSNALF